MTGRVAHEVYDGVRCAVCEQPFTPHEMHPFTGMRTFLRETGEYVHTVCPDGDRADPAKHMWRTLVRVVAVDAINKPAPAFASGTTTIPLSFHDGCTPAPDTPGQFMLSREIEVMAHRGAAWLYLRFRRGGLQIEALTAGEARELAAALTAGAAVLGAPIDERTAP